MKKITKETMEQRIERLKKANKKSTESPNTGKRGKGKKTLRLEEAHKKYKRKVVSELSEITDAQMRLAKGHDYLYKKVTTGKGKERKRKWELVTDPQEILDYLNGEFDDNSGDEDYYKVTTVKPDNRAIDSALDRTIGKPKDKLEVGGEGGGPMKLDVRILKAGDRAYGKRK